MVNFFIERERRTTKYYLEDLGNGIALDMILIPGGSFMMGASEDELESSDRERPQHKVSVPTFFMGRYPVTQEQWRAVVALPQVNRELQPDPSQFKGDMRPVEQVNWYQAVEFCARLTRLASRARLSQHTGREYRLPSEAQWEYACRAGTTTPFHFGETITTDLANYNGKNTYGEGSKGEYRKETTTVDTFKIANNFGLCNMHGLVWEWCLDYWHENYQNAPSDGSAWVSGGDSDLRVIRGGSWNFSPDFCRSAARDLDNPKVAYLNDIGFRVVCMVPRT
ncbi:MAG: formylglycine-generating enzyme family protein [Xenococcus sp. MO_188.B8]|nr:formylglycine-generating enzyme family protein [Xenococcus sp. MO_188.B8]